MVFPPFPPATSARWWIPPSPPAGWAASYLRVSPNATTRTVLRPPAATVTKCRCERGYCSPPAVAVDHKGSVGPATSDGPRLPQHQAGAVARWAKVGNRCRRAPRRRNPRPSARFDPTTRVPTVAVFAMRYRSRSPAPHLGRRRRGRWCIRSTCLGDVQRTGDVHLRLLRTVGRVGPGVATAPTRISAKATAPRRTTPSERSFRSPSNHRATPRQPRRHQGRSRRCGRCSARGMTSGRPGQRCERYFCFSSSSRALVPLATRTKNWVCLMCWPFLS